MEKSGEMMDGFEDAIDGVDVVVDDDVWFWWVVGSDGGVTGGGCLGSMEEQKLLEKVRKRWRAAE